MQLFTDHLVLGVFLLVLCIQIYYYLHYFTAIPAFRVKESPGKMVPVSVIIVARNELAKLEAYLESYVNLDYPEYEIVIVDNGSWDGTAKFLEAAVEMHKKLKVVSIAEDEKYPKGKKFGLTLGIKAAKYETLVLTDADCIPKHRNWLRHMVNAYEQQTEIVLGYSPYLKTKTLLNLFIRFETLYTAMQYLSFAIKGKPYMGVGRNLSYKKESFFRVKGFAKHNHIISGDDDLFINEVASKQNTMVCLHPESFVYSIPKYTFGEWLRQRKDIFLQGSITKLQIR